MLTKEIKKNIKSLLFGTGLFLDTPSQRLKKYGYEALFAIKQVSRELSIPMYPIFGTLLGAYREHDFIEFDDDLDIALDIEYLSKELLNCLSNHGFSLHHFSVSSDFKGLLLSMRYKKIVSEIYFSYSNDSKKVFYIPKPVRGDNWAYSFKYNVYRVKEIQVPNVSTFEDCKIGDLIIDIPANTKEILSSVYGDNFLTPIKNAHANPPSRLYEINEKFFRTYPVNFFMDNSFITYLTNNKNNTK